MKRTMIALLIGLLASVVLAQKDGDATSGSRAKSFSVGKGGNLEVSTNVGEIHIAPWEKNEVYVRVEGIDEEDLDRLKMSQNGNTVRVTFKPRYSNYGSVRFEINVPSQFNLELKTSGGDLIIAGAINGKIKGTTAGGEIRLGNVDGTVEMTTSGGNVRAGDISGDGYLRTAGGDIDVGKVGGELEVSTSGGDINITSVVKSVSARTAGGEIRVGNVGGEAHVSTSGGDIKMGKVSGRVNMSTAGGNIELKGASGTVRASTSGGDVHLENVTGSIDARTAGGEVDAELIPSGKGSSKLSSSGGKVSVAVPEHVKATIEATIQITDRSRRKSDRY
ncbi:MAG: DUF4097 family beta strand repeat protein, partial [Ignavibacteriales bacterium]|nr:DUF4097 family beta strand repeat protein [Ignavibacteriales bacterium]